jgi:LacI family transcriptional regulator
VAPQEAEKSWFDLSGPGSRVAARMLAQVHRPDAILCSNDYLAIGAAAACADAGLRVPDNIAVTGFDNINMGAYLPGAPLTTVAQPSEQMAKKAVEILLALIRKASREHLQMSVELPCSLVVRASCGAGPKRLD